MYFEKVTNLEGVQIIKPTVCQDSRGFFFESYKKSEFKEHGILDDFIQDNHSKSARGVLRGLHYQSTPAAQAKLVRCIKGSILDFAVNINPESQSYTEWTSVILSEENKKMLYIPEGYAHGFLALTEGAEIVYKTNNEYNHSLDRGIAYNDESINIPWGTILSLTGINKVILSDKDKNQPTLREEEINGRL